MREISWQDEKPVVSEEGLRSMELVNQLVSIRVEFACRIWGKQKCRLCQDSN